MSIPQVVVDTNVIVAGLRSRRGSAFKMLTLIGTGQFDIHLSVPLVLEYTDVLLRELPKLSLNREELDDLYQSSKLELQMFTLPPTAPPLAKGRTGGVICVVGLQRFGIN